MVRIQFNRSSSFRDEHIQTISLTLSLSTSAALGLYAISDNRVWSSKKCAALHLHRLFVNHF